MFRIANNQFLSISSLGDISTCRLWYYYFIRCLAVALLMTIYGTPFARAPPFPQVASAASTADYIPYRCDFESIANSFSVILEPKVAGPYTVLINSCVFARPLTITTSSGDAGIPLIDVRLVLTNVTAASLILDASVVLSSGSSLDISGFNLSGAFSFAASANSGARVSVSDLMSNSEIIMHGANYASGAQLVFKNIDIASDLYGFYWWTSKLNNASLTLSNCRFKTLLSKSHGFLQNGGSALNTSITLENLIVTGAGHAVYFSDHALGLGSTLRIAGCVFSSESVGVNALRLLLGSAVVDYEKTNVVMRGKVEITHGYPVVASAPSGGTIHIANSNTAVLDYNGVSTGVSRGLRLVIDNTTATTLNINLGTGQRTTLLVSKAQVLMATAPAILTLGECFDCDVVISDTRFAHTLSLTNGGSGSIQPITFSRLVMRDTSISAHLQLYTPIANSTALIEGLTIGLTLDINGAITNTNITVRSTVFRGESTQQAIFLRSLVFATSLFHLDRCIVSSSSTFVVQVIVHVNNGSVHRYTNNVLNSLFTYVAAASGIIYYGASNSVSRVNPGGLVHLSNNTFRAATSGAYIVNLVSLGGQIVHDDLNKCDTTGIFAVKVEAPSTPGHILQINNFTNLQSINIQSSAGASSPSVGTIVELTSSKAHSINLGLGRVLNSSLTIRSSRIATTAVVSWTTCMSCSVSITDTYVGGDLSFAGTVLVASCLSTANSNFMSNLIFSSAFLNTTAVIVDSSVDRSLDIPGTSTNSSIYVSRTLVRGNHTFPLKVRGAFIGSKLHLDSCTVTTDSAFVLQTLVDLTAGSVHRFSNNTFISTYTSNTAITGILYYGSSAYPSTIQKGSLVHISNNSFKSISTATYAVYVISSGGLVVHDGLNRCESAVHFSVRMTGSGPGSIVHLSKYKNLQSVTVTQESNVKSSDADVRLVSCSANYATLSLGDAFDSQIIVQDVQLASFLRIETITCDRCVLSASELKIATSTTLKGRFIGSTITLLSSFLEKSVILDLTSVKAGTNVSIRNNTLLAVLDIRGQYEGKDSSLIVTNNTINTTGTSAVLFSNFALLRSFAMLFSDNVIRMTLSVSQLPYNAIYMTSATLGDGCSFLLVNNTIHGSENGIMMESSPFLAGSVLFMTGNFIRASKATMTVNLYGGLIRHDASNTHIGGDVSVYQKAAAASPALTQPPDGAGSVLIISDAVVGAVRYHATSFSYHDYVLIKRCRTSSSVGFSVQLATSANTTVVLRSVEANVVTVTTVNATDARVGIEDSRTNATTFSGAYSSGSAVWIHDTNTTGPTTLRANVRCEALRPCLVSVRRCRLVSASSAALSLDGGSLINDYTHLSITNNTIVSLGAQSAAVLFTSSTSSTLTRSASLAVANNVIESAGATAMNTGGGLSCSGSVDVWGNTFVRGSASIALGLSPSKVLIVGNTAPSFMVSGPVPSAVTERYSLCNKLSNGTYFAVTGAGLQAFAVGCTALVSPCGRSSVQYAADGGPFVPCVSLPGVPSEVSYDRHTRPNNISVFDNLDTDGTHVNMSKVLEPYEQRIWPSSSSSPNGSTCAVSLVAGSVEEELPPPTHTREVTFSPNSSSSRSLLGTRTNRYHTVSILRSPTRASQRTLTPAIGDSEGGGDGASQVSRTIWTLKPIPAPPGAAVETSKQVSAAVGVAIGVASLGSVTGGQLGVANAMARLASCDEQSEEEEEEEGVPILVHPLRFSVWRRDGADGMYFAAAVSNMFIIPLFVGVVSRFVLPRVLIAVWAAMSGARRRHEANPARATLREALATIGWPFVVAMPIVTLAEGTAVSIVRSLRSDSYVGTAFGVMGLAPLVAFLALWVRALAVVIPRRHLTLEPAFEHGPQYVTLAQRIEWLVTPTHHWAPKVPTPAKGQRAFDENQGAVVLGAAAAEEGTLPAVAEKGAGGDKQDVEEEEEMEELLLVEGEEEQNSSSNDNNSNDFRGPVSEDDIEHYGNALGDKRLYYAEITSFVCSLVVGAMEGVPAEHCRPRAVVAAVATILQCVCSCLTLVPLELGLQLLSSLCVVPMSLIVIARVFEQANEDVVDGGDTTLEAVTAVLLMAVNILGLVLLALALIFGSRELLTRENESSAAEENITIGARNETSKTKHAKSSSCATTSLASIGHGSNSSRRDRRRSDIALLVVARESEEDDIDIDANIQSRGCKEDNDDDDDDADSTQFENTSNNGTKNIYFDTSKGQILVHGRDGKRPLRISKDAIAKNINNNNDKNVVGRQDFKDKNAKTAGRKASSEQSNSPQNSRVGTNLSGSSLSDKKSANRQKSIQILKKATSTSVGVISSEDI